VSLHPFVGITLRPQLAEGLPPRLVQNRAYVDSLIAAGAIPLPIAPTGDSDILRALYDRCDALLLPGGPDVEPHRYGEEPRPECHVTSAPELDAAELVLTRWALADGKPLLGICRGLQVLNVALGGSLWQDIAVQGAGDHGHDSADRAALVHEVEVAPGTTLGEVIGKARLRWNSLHHQGIHRVGAGLVPVAHSPDGVVEGVEIPGSPVLAVQCHPEELTRTQPWAHAIVRWLVEAAASAS
jgi:putative glutamine amidotransferase